MAKPASPGQLRLLDGMAARSSLDIPATCQGIHGKPAAELTFQQASELIDLLKDTERLLREYGEDYNGVGERRAPVGSTSGAWRP